MPQAAIVAGITAAGAIGSGFMSSRSSNKATRAQQDANRRAMEFEREQFEYEKARQEKAEAQRQAAWDAYQAQREPYRRAAQAVMSRWGFPGSGPTYSSTPPPDWAPGAPNPAASGRAPAPPTMLSRPVDDPNDPTSVAPPMMAPRLTLGNLSNWNRVIGLG